MMHYGIIDKIRRITIPKAVLRELGWKEGDEVVLDMNFEKNSLVIRKNRCQCYSCGKEDGLTFIGKDGFLCRECLQKRYY